MRAAVGACLGVAAGALFTLGAVLVLDDGDSGSDGGDSSLAGSVAPTADSAADRGGDVLVFLDQDVTDAQRQSIEAWLDRHPEVASIEYWDQAESLAEARRLFRHNPEMLAKIDANPEAIPASYRLALTTAGLGSAGRIAVDADGLPGVLRSVVPKGRATQAP
ncbi:MAG TPA: permease-like cell division protein FtsX [Acidimicrobiales bacterium]|nr:permease-like cell division protein FtsX [Acidimicrobiales bacterium]